MTIYRANADTVKKIMTGKMLARAFTILGLGAAKDAQGVGTGSGSESGIPDGGADFRMRLDSAALTYTPPQASPKKVWENGKPGTYLEIKISDAVPVLYCNSNFECSLPDTQKASVARGSILALGWTSAAGPVDSEVPAANNHHLT